MTALRGKRHWQQVDASVREAVAEVAAAQEADREAHRALGAAVVADRAAAVAVPVEQIRAATHVRDRRTGDWHQVIRVNKATVTVATGYSWTDRIPLEDVIAVQVCDDLGLGQLLDEGMS